MSKHVNTIAGRLSLRAPQRQSLEILERITEIVPPRKNSDIATALEIIRKEYPTVTDFEREFPSLCFALATGVGKTRLMGAFISYLYIAYGIRNFFVLAPNLTIYNKLIADFTPNTPKYVFTGIAEFATEPPLIITGENYEQPQATSNLFPVKINIFNISKMNSEVRGGKAPRIKRLNELLGESYFNYLSGHKDLVLIMDESHRYRASAGIRAINELNPVLGLELTATPFVETGKGPVSFKNVIYDYPLGKAMIDGFVKEPAVVTRKNFNPAGMSNEEIERLKIDDGIRLHESVKVELETYARETGNRLIKPFLLIIARDTTHAGQLLRTIQSDEFFYGTYKTKVIQVDSSKSGVEEDEMVSRLLAVESPDEPTEIVIHVNMLKEGWDVTNLYTIVPLRAANARTLIEQSIGRGLRLPYGKRTGVMSVDRLNIVAHDRFQEIIEEANRPESTIRLQQIILTDDILNAKQKTVVSSSILSNLLGLSDSNNSTSDNNSDTKVEKQFFDTPEEQNIAKITYNVIHQMAKKTSMIPVSSYLNKPEIQQAIVEEVTKRNLPLQTELEGLGNKTDIRNVISKTTDLFIQGTIDIPRILIVPKGEVKCGFNRFTLDSHGLNYPAPSEELWIQHLRTNHLEIIGVSGNSFNENRLEDFIVSGLMDFDDISYDDHADLLYDLATQTVEHFKSYLSEDDTRKVLRLHQKEIAKFIHAQMMNHYWEEAIGYEVKISKGFTELKEGAYSVTEGSGKFDYRQSPSDKSNMSRYSFGGFSKCLYPAQKFHSDSERKFSVILERDARKWFRPLKGQFSIYYPFEGKHHEYQPDFVAETKTNVYMVETKMKSEMNSPEVLAKKQVAVEWCRNASNHAKTYNGKEWKYLLIPHDVIAENMTLDILERQFEMK